MPGAVHADQIAASPGFVAETTKLTFSNEDADYRLDTLIIRPEGPGPFPVVVISHGGSSEAEERKRLELDSYRWPAEEFARRGYMAVFFLRPGYGDSRGIIVERRTACHLSDTLRAGHLLTRMVKGVIERVKARPEADPSRIVVAGDSFGAFGAIALTAEDVPGLRAVLAFAGGTGYQGADCQLEATTAAYERYGKAARVPTLWVYAENDHTFPALAAPKASFAAYTAGGGNGQFVVVPPFSTDGHLYFGFGVPLWRKEVGQFLMKLGLPFGADGIGEFVKSDFAPFWTQASHDIIEMCTQDGRLGDQSSCGRIIRCAGDRIARDGNIRTIQNTYRSLVYDTTAPDLDHAIDLCRS